MKRRDPVTPELRAAVLARDEGCVAPRLGAPDPCSGRLTLDHVKREPRMGKRAESTMGTLVTLCEAHHLGGRRGYIWATANRPALREYLRRVTS